MAATVQHRIAVVKNALLPHFLSAVAAALLVQGGTPPTARAEDWSSLLGLDQETLSGAATEGGRAVKKAGARVQEAAQDVVSAAPAVVAAPSNTAEAAFERANALKEVLAKRREELASKAAATSATATAPVQKVPSQATEAVSGRSSKSGHGYMPLFLAQLLVLLAIGGVFSAAVLLPATLWENVKQRVAPTVEKLLAIVSPAEKVVSMGTGAAEKAGPYVVKAFEVAAPAAQKAYQAAKPLAAEAVEAAKPIFKQGQEKASDMVGKAMSSAKASTPKD